MKSLIYSNLIMLHLQFTFWKRQSNNVVKILITENYKWFQIVDMRDKMEALVIPLHRELQNKITLSYRLQKQNRYEKQNEFPSWSLFKLYI